MIKQNILQKISIVSAVTLMIGFAQILAPVSFAASTMQTQQVAPNTFVTNDLTSFFKTANTNLTPCSYDGCDGGSAQGLGCTVNETELSTKPVADGSNHYGTLSLWAGGGSCPSAFWTAFQNISGSTVYYNSVLINQGGYDAESGGPTGSCIPVASGHYVITAMLNGFPHEISTFYGHSVTSDKSNCSSTFTTNTETWTWGG